MSESSISTEILDGGMSVSSDGARPMTRVVDDPSSVTFPLESSESSSSLHHSSTSGWDPYNITVRSLTTGSYVAQNRTYRSSAVSETFHVTWSFYGDLTQTDFRYRTSRTGSWNHATGGSTSFDFTGYTGESYDIQVQTYPTVYGSLKRASAIREFRFSIGWTIPGTPGNVRVTIPAGVGRGGMVDIETAVVPTTVAWNAVPLTWQEVIDRINPGHAELLFGSRIEVSGNYLVVSSQGDGGGDGKATVVYYNDDGAWRHPFLLGGFYGNVAIHDDPVNGTFVVVGRSDGKAFVFHRITSDEESYTSVSSESSSGLRSASSTSSEGPAVETQSSWQTSSTKGESQSSVDRLNIWDHGMELPGCNFDTAPFVAIHYGLAIAGQRLYENPDVNLNENWNLVQDFGSGADTSHGSSIASTVLPGGIRDYIFVLTRGGLAYFYRRQLDDTWVSSGSYNPYPDFDNHPYYLRFTGGITFRPALSYQYCLFASSINYVYWNDSFVGGSAIVYERMSEDQWTKVYDPTYFSTTQAEPDNRPYAKSLSNDQFVTVHAGAANTFTLSGQTWSRSELAAAIPVYRQDMVAVTDDMAQILHGHPDFVDRGGTQVGDIRIGYSSMSYEYRTSPTGEWVSNGNAASAVVNYSEGPCYFGVRAVTPLNAGEEASTYWWYAGYAESESSSTLLSLTSTTHRMTTSSLGTSSSSTTLNLSTSSHSGPSSSSRSSVSSVSSASSSSVSSSSSKSSSSQSSSSSTWIHAMETPTELEVVSADPVANSVTIGWRWSTFSRLGEWVVPTGFVVERSIDGGEWVVLTYSVTSNEMPAGRRACKLVDSDILMGETSPNGIYFEGPVVNSTISYHRPALEEVLGDQDWYIWHDPVVGWVLGMHLGVLTEPYWFRGGDVNGQYAPSPGSGAFSATVTDATAETSSLSESESSGWRRYTYTDMLSLADATAVFAVGVPVSYRVRAYLVT